MPAPRNSPLAAAAPPPHIPTLPYANFCNVVRIGRGGFASIYSAQYTRADGATLAVALKVLDVGVDMLQQDKVAMNELKMHYSMSSSYVARCRGLTVTPSAGSNSLGKVGNLVIVMDLYEGSLSNVLSHAGYRTLPTAGRVWLAKQVSHAVEFLTVNGIVHGDIKPQNYLWAVKGSTAVVKISDFGNSRLRDMQHSKTIAVSANVAGTLYKRILRH